MRRNPYRTTQEFHRFASPALQVAADKALEALAQFPNHPGFAWAVELQRGNGSIIDLLDGTGEALLAAGGDLHKVDPILIPGGGIVCQKGSYLAGSPPDERGRSITETQFEAIIQRTFALGRYPVTQELYGAVMKKNPSFFQHTYAAAQSPVESVSWFHALRFCNRLSLMLGLEPVYDISESNPIQIKTNFAAQGIRLPTQEEWEYAARSGGDPFLYAGSDDIRTVGWCDLNSNQRTHEVGSKEPNRWGFYDMSGNVWEWVHVMDTGNKGKPVTTDTISERDIRGGSWYSPDMWCRVASHTTRAAGSQSSDTGFRICRTLPDSKNKPQRRK